MKTKLNQLVGESSKSTFKEINLNAEAYFMFKDEQVNPLLDPCFCSSWVDYLARKNDVDYTYGGYMEHRWYMWRKSYLNYGSSIHLGIDINVAALNTIHVPIAFTVVDIVPDPDKNFGWGYKILIKTKNGLVVFGHVYPHGIIIGKKYKAGHSIGWVAHSDNNGGWFPHVHIQGIKNIEQMNGIDGYGKHCEGIEKIYPNPLNLLGIK